jgi:hypothetical protein
MDILKYSPIRIIPKILDNLSGDNKVSQLEKEAEDYKLQLKKMQAAQEGKQQSTGMKKGGKVSSASKRADGCAIRGKTKA